MSDQPNSTASTENFEFEALAQARNYRRALLTEFGSYLRGKVVEVGAGIGQMTGHLVELPGVERAIAVEPEGRFCARHRALFPRHELVEGTVADLPTGTTCDAILSVNVLEHIRDDEDELKRYAALLSERHGALCLFVPARRELYAPIDRDFGHFRRYTRPELRTKLRRGGFQPVRLYYFNCVGYFAWWLSFRLLKRRRFGSEQVRLYDRIVFPVVHALESRIIRPPFGQNLLAVARAGHQSI
jgi:SAM-dependent methyltransferase